MASEVPSTPVANYAAVEDVKGSEQKLIASNKSNGRTDNYKPIFLGQSAFDLWFIPLCLIGLWGLVGILFTLLLQAVVKTSSTDAALWMFFAVFFVCACIAALFLNLKDVNAKSPSADDSA